MDIGKLGEENKLLWGLISFSLSRTRIIFYFHQAELMFQLVDLRSSRNGYRIIDSFAEANDFEHQFSRCSGFLKRWCPDPLWDGIGILRKLARSSPRLLESEICISTIRIEQGNVRHLPRRRFSPFVTLVDIFKRLESVRTDNL